MIETEEGADIKSITNTGIVVAADDDTVEIYLEKYDTTVRYTGLEEISVKKDDDIKSLSIKGSDGKNKKLLGKSSGRVTIYVYHNGAYYDMEDFLKTASSNQSSGSGTVTGFLGGACLSFEESEAFWEIIDNDRSVDGGATHNCTRFTNYMIGLRWGSDYYAPVYGDGYQKVSLIVSAFGSMGVEELDADSLPDEAYNLAFSYTDNSYGHTGWIDEIHKDSSMEGGGYVIVSEGNVGSNSLIRWQQKYTYDEWYEKVGQHCTFAYNPNATQTELDGTTPE